MKYGETLRQRSIPAWAHYNVDYDEIKRVIKENTTPGNGKGVSIPGQGNSVERSFEKDILNLFELEQRRVDLFVKTKSGEIDRRLKHLGQQISRLAERERIQDRATTRTPSRRLERYAKLEEDVLTIGQELNSLSRYLNAQRTAFHKLLKKYKKWTGSEGLQEKVKQTMMSQPGTFWKTDVGPLFDRYTELLQVIRSALEPAAIDGNAASRRKFSRRPSVRNSTGAAISMISKAVEFNAELDFDVALTTTPFGEKGGKAVYWINPESTIELQVFLLRHMRLLIPQAMTKSSPFSSAPQSPTETPLRRRSNPGVDGDEKDDSCGTLILDIAERYAQQEIGKTVEDNEGIPGLPPTKALGQVLWSSAGEAIAKVGGITPNQEAFKTARMKRKHISAVLDTGRPLLRRPSIPTLNNPDAAKEAAEESIKTVRDWLASNVEVSAIAGHVSKRTRYLGLSNNSSRAIWATLDKTVHFKGHMVEDLTDNDWTSKISHNNPEFPHHVLQVRYEGFESADLIAALDKSHLTERIRGFSLETHAVWQCCQPASMQPPLWLPMVDRPISNVPEEDKRRFPRMGSLTGSSDLSAPERLSLSMTSNTDGDNTTSSTPLTAGADTSNTSAPDQLESPALSSFRKKRKRTFPQRTTTFASQSEHEEPSQGYWNEYDHPEDGASEDAFVIYVDPNASTIPGEELFWRAYHKVKSFFGRSRPMDEESPLLVDLPTRAGDSSESSDEEDNFGSFDPRSNRYGTMATPLNPNSTKPRNDAILPNLWPFSSQTSHNSPLQHFDNPAEVFAAAEARYREREQQKFRLYLTSLGAAVTILAILVILTMTSRHKYRDEVDAGLIIGIVANLIFAFTGVGYMISRQDHLSWLHRGAVALVFVGVCIVDGMLLTWALS